MLLECHYKLYVLRDFEEFAPIILLATPFT